MNPTFTAHAPSALHAAAAVPFIKWVGGKRRLLPALRARLPTGVEQMRHVEPFLGGGALFFDRSPQRALLCDVNHDLVETYKAVRDDVELVLQHLRALADQHSEPSYYQARERYNARAVSARVERAALFIYLNKTCFNGLYRVNKRGLFNVPIGRYANPAIVSADTLRLASARLQGIDVRCSSFPSLLELVQRGDFVYLDPPYEPVTRTASFTAYAAGGFTQDDQRRLCEVYRELDRRGAKLMLSNADTALIHELYRDFLIERVRAPRAINCRTTRRGLVHEVIVRNYTAEPLRAMAS